MRARGKAGLEVHLELEEARPGGSYRLCPCGLWHYFDVECPTGLSDALTLEEYREGFDRE